MFESAETGQKITREAFAAREPELRMRLLKAQQRIQQVGTPVLILLAGVEGADRSGVVKRLNAWLDPRYLRTYAFWDETDEERERPYYWRFWRCMPARGETAIMFGSWYTKPIIDRAFDHIDAKSFNLALQTIKNHEQLLADDNHVVIKLWFHLSSEKQQQRLAEKKRAGKSQTAALFKKFAKHYDTFVKVSEQALRHTNTASNPWHIINASNRRFRDVSAADIILHTLENHPAKIPQVDSTASLPIAKQNILKTVDLSQTLEPDHYAELLKNYQKKLAQQVWLAKEQMRDMVILFEGWDAAGKGGAIRRITQSIDARLYTVIPIAAPTDEKKRTIFYGDSGAMYHAMVTSPSMIARGMAECWLSALKVLPRRRHGNAPTMKSIISSNSCPMQVQYYSNSGYTFRPKNNYAVSGSAKSYRGNSTKSPTKTGATVENGQPINRLYMIW